MLERNIENNLPSLKNPPQTGDSDPKKKAKKQGAPQKSTPNRRSEEEQAHIAEKAHIVCPPSHVRHMSYHVSC